MADKEDVVSLVDYRLNNGGTSFSAKMRALKTTDLESRCLSSFYSEADQYDLVAAAELYRRDKDHPLGLVGKAIMIGNAGSYSKCMSTLDYAEENCPGNRELILTRAMMYVTLLDHRDFRPGHARRFVRDALGLHFDDPDIMEALLRVSIFVLRDHELSMQIYDTMPGADAESREFYHAHIGLLVKELDEDAADAAELAKAAEKEKAEDAAGKAKQGAKEHPHLRLVK
ncbi:hypothetical protein KY363_02875 [Candidatus Woesearchaeota archaeon]|nr:hypothetical protein [Candidatus Woesearchaeota archaeon]